MPLEKFFSAIGRILQCHWKNSVELEGGWEVGQATRAGPDTQKSKFFLVIPKSSEDSLELITGFVWLQKTNFSGPAGPDKNDNFYHLFKFFVFRFF